MNDLSNEEAGFEYRLRFPLEDIRKDIRVACSNCSRVSPLSPRQIEEQGLPFGWQLRLLYTHIAEGHSVRWDLYCHACAGEASPRSPRSIRIRARVRGTGGTGAADGLEKHDG